MKISNAQSIAADQFIQGFSNKSHTIELLERYAREELGLDRDRAMKFAKESEEGAATEWLNTRYDKIRFYTWYCINYVSLEQYRNSTN